MALFSIETYGELEPHIRQEWLLTNGLGGFASSTVVGCNARRYHGILCAATLPPVGRVMALNRVGEILCLDGNNDQLLELSVNQFRESMHPRGDRYLRRFELEDVARWEYEVGGVRVVKELQLPWLQNVAVLRYTITPNARRKVQFSVLPFVSMRDFHGMRRAQDASFQTHTSERGLSVTQGNNTVHIQSDVGTYQAQPGWWYGHVYRIESERGMEDAEDLFNPGRLEIESETDAPMTLTIWAAMDSIGMPDWDAELNRRREAVLSACTDPENATAGPSAVCTSQSMPIRKLSRAANDFIVYRKNPRGGDGTSIIAGYPWFADWGRDTMISLPGLLLTPGRFHQARQVLTVFAEYVSGGMIPNRFDDYTNQPHYNTVDASLWFIHAAFEYGRLANDSHTFETVLLPACKEILKGYRDGTRFHIVMDPADALITQGDPTTQLTWMDAKCDGIAFTPRQGKAVEINALWYHALVLMGEKELAATVRESFQKTFWISPFRGLCDVVDGQRKDVSIRPNQIFAVSLPNSALTNDQQHAVVEVVKRELLTPMGLRTLAKSDPRYIGRYAGPVRQRDEAYHNGAVWPWLIGGFLDAYLRVNNESTASKEQVKQWLAPLIASMDEACIGQLHEICEADEPHRPVGCFAQAWSVAEVLRIAVKVGM
jgi:predicted glycogen debranching enzyme